MTVAEVLEVISSLQDDASVSKNMKLRLSALAQMLMQGESSEMAVPKALEELDDLSQNANLQPFVRSQLWNMTSLLESINVR